MGYLAAHFDRPVRRVKVATLLWPDLETGSARANLRVVLADLNREFERLSIKKFLLVDSETLLLRSAPDFLTDGALLDIREGPLVALRNLCAPGPWLEGAEENTSEEFAAWLLSYRQQMQATLERCATGPAEHRASPAESPSVTSVSHNILAVPDLDLAPGSRKGHLTSEAPLPLIAPAYQASLDGSRVAVVTLLRVEVAETRTEQARGCPPVNIELLELLASEARSFNGCMFDPDDAGASFVFGAQSRHPGQRWLALRAAAAMHAIVQGRFVLRMGLTSGRVTLAHSAPLPVNGWRTRLVDRLALAADGGHIVCDDSFVDMARVFRFSALEPRQFRGFAQKIRLFGRALDDATTMLLPPRGDITEGFFARESSLAEAENLFARAMQSGSTHAGVSITGESGLGATRLAWELAHRRQARGQRVFWLDALPEACNVPFRSLHGLVSGILSGSGTVEHRLNNALTALTVSLSAEGRRAVAGFISSHQVPQSMRVALIEAIAALLRGPAGHSTLVVVDDAPLLDAATVDVLNRIMQSDSLLINWLLTCRLGQTHSLAVPQLALLNLPRLDDAECVKVLENAPGAGELSPRERRDRITNARGVPLYLFADSGASGASGHFDEFLQAMMNRLGTARSVLEMAAVLGMLFDTNDLTALCGADRTGAACEIGLANGLLVARTSHQLSFSHPQLREHLLTSIPQTIVAQHACQAAHLLSRQQRHPEAARLWQLGGAKDQAQIAWRAAAVDAMALDDFSSACDSWMQLRTMGDTNAVNNVSDGIALSRCLIARDGFGSAQAHQFALEAYAAAAAMNTLDADTEFAALALAYLGSSSQGHTDGVAFAQRMLVSASTPAQQHAAFWAMGNTLFWLAEFDTARHWLERNVELGLQLSVKERMCYFPSDLAAFARAELGWLLWFIGEPETSHRMLQEATAYAQRSATRQDLCICSCFAGFVAWCEGDRTALALHARTAGAIAHREGLVFWACISDMMHALACADVSLPVDLPALMASSAGMLKGYAAAVNTARWLISDALVATGQYDMALALIEETLAASAESEHRQCAMDLWRLKAVALARLDRAAESEVAFDTAVSLATALGAKGWIARWNRL